MYSTTVSTDYIVVCNSLNALAMIQLVTITAYNSGRQLQIQQNSDHGIIHCTETETFAKDPVYVRLLWVGLVNARLVATKKLPGFSCMFG